MGSFVPASKCGKSSGSGIGVSRIPIREALVALEREGWVTSPRNRGTFIGPFDDDTIRIHFELEGLVCALATRRAVARATDEDVERLRAAQKRVVAGKSPTALLEAHGEFLRTLLSVARSPRLASTLRGFSSVIPGNLFEIIPGSGLLQQGGTKHIAVAIEHRDQKAAADASTRLAEAQADLVIEVVSSRPAWIGSRR